MTRAVLTGAVAILCLAVAGCAGPRLGSPMAQQNNATEQQRQDQFDRTQQRRQAYRGSRESEQSEDRNRPPAVNPLSRDRDLGIAPMTAPAPTPGRVF